MISINNTSGNIFFYADLFKSDIIYCISYYLKDYLIFQSLSMNMTSKSGMLIQFIIPYLAVIIEAFVFCFAGEYLSTKVNMLLLLSIFLLLH